MHVSVFVATVHLGKHQHTQRSDWQLNESLSSVFKVYYNNWWWLMRFVTSCLSKPMRIEAFLMMDCISITSFLMILSWVMYILPMSILHPFVRLLISLRECKCRGDGCSCSETSCQIYRLGNAAQGNFHHM